MMRTNATRKSLVIGGALALALTISLVPRAESQISTTDINQLIDQITSGGFDPSTIPGLTGTIPTDTGTGTDDGTDPDNGNGAPTERVPQVVSNQFTTVQGGSLQARRPGLWIQQGIAFRATGEPALSGDVPNEPGFFKETLLLMFDEVIDSINDFINTINLGLALGDITGGGGIGGITPIPNAATTGQGTSTPIQ